MTEPIHPLVAVAAPRPMAPTPPSPMQRSLYLGQALRSLRENAMRPDAAPDIRGAGALATNLLAEALRRYGQNRDAQQQAAAQPDPAAPAPPDAPVAQPVAAPLQIGNGPNPSLPGAPDPTATPSPGAAPAPPATGSAPPPPGYRLVDGRRAG